jgi:hypothetical protein
MIILKNPTKIVRIRSEFLELDGVDEALEKYKILVLDIINGKCNIEQNELLFTNIYPMFRKVSLGRSCLVIVVILKGKG